MIVEELLCAKVFKTRKLKFSILINAGQNYEIIVGCGRAGNTFFCLFGTLFENITLEKKKSIGATLIGSVTHDIRSSLPAEKLRFPF
jgi:hypothetical protein